MAECPYIMRDEVPNSDFNELKTFTTNTGEQYVFYIHNNGYGKKTKVQFCTKIGRKQDVLECLNESEWRACSAYRSGMAGGKGG